MANPDSAPGSSAGPYRPECTIAGRPSGTTRASQRLRTSAANARRSQTSLDRLCGNDVSLVPGRSGVRARTSRGCTRVNSSGTRSIVRVTEAFLRTGGTEPASAIAPLDNSRTSPALVLVRFLTVDQARPAPRVIDPNRRTRPGQRFLATTSGAIPKPPLDRPWQSNRAARFTTQFATAGGESRSCWFRKLHRCPNGIDANVGQTTPAAGCVNSKLPTTGTVVLSSTRVAVSERSGIRLETRGNAKLLYCPPCRRTKQIVARPCPSVGLSASLPLWSPASG